MRKYNYSLIKKTERRFGLVRGRASVEAPLGRLDPTLTLAEIHGDTADAEIDYTYVGDESEGGGYSIKFSRAGRNLMSGDTYAALHKAGVSGNTTNDGNIYFWVALSKDAGKDIVTKNEIDFKPNTVYTIAARMKYIAISTNYSPFQAKVVYTDGTDELIHFYKIPDKEPYVVFSTAEGKSVEKIIHHNENSAPMRLYLASFGIFEGKYDTYEEAFEPYGSVSSETPIAAPLRSLGHVRDILDLKESKIIRKLERYLISGESSISETEDESIFRVELDYAARDGTPIRCEERKCTQEELSERISGIAFASDNRAVYIKLDGINSINDFVPRVTEAPIPLVYILDEYREEKLTGDLPLADDKGGTVNINTALPPYKFIIIYERKDE